MNFRKFFKQGVIRAFTMAEEVVLHKRDRARRKQLAVRDQERRDMAGRWFIPHEYTLVAALAALIVPSDETGPGAAEAGAVDTLDRMVATSPGRQMRYAQGLLGFDELAERKYGRPFAKLMQNQQVHLLGLLDRAYNERKTRGTSILDKVERKVRDLSYKWCGLGQAADLFPRLVNDVMEAFYTSRIAWNWLGYDGPPFPSGDFGPVGGPPPE